jgi:hypothetical protein
MKISILVILLFSTTIAVCQLSDKVIRDFKTGKILHDNTYIYCLPYELGKRYLFVQGANSNMSHKNEL